MSAGARVAVLGAGPAGANAALAAAAAGAKVLLVDDQPRPGGQVWRAKSEAIAEAPPTPESRSGDALRAAIASSAVTCLRDTRLWSIERQDELWSLRLLREGRTRVETADQLILAPGAREYVQPLPGWTTPGVIGLAGATALMKRDQLAPGRAVVVCGTGPLVFFVAAEIRRLGGSVRAVVTPNARADWRAALPALARRPGLASRGATWLADLALARIPVLWRHTVTRVHGTGRATGVDIQSVAADWTPQGPVRRIEADSLCLGHGLVPNIEPARLAGLGLVRDPVAGTWVPETREDGSTERPGLFACGDGADIRGALAAATHGRIAGLTAAAAAAQGDGPPPGLLAGHRRALSFGAAMAALSRRRHGLDALTTPDTLVCRCEGVTREAIEAEIAGGAAGANAVKAGLRAGMGPCGGKVCGAAIVSILAQAQGLDPASVAPATVRPPLMPVPLDALAGDFRYNDLPIGKPTPL